MKKKPRDVISLSGKAVSALRLKQGLKLADLIRKTDLSRNTLSLLESGRSPVMLRENAEKIAKALDAELAEILLDEKVEQIPNNPILGYMGLKEIPVERADDVPFTKWSITSTNQPLAYLWYALGDELHIEAGSDGEYLRAKFKSKSGPLPINIAAHPYEHSPRLLSAAQTSIGFGVFAIEGDNLAVGVRVTDKRGREWIYSDDAPYSPHPPMHQFELKRGVWVPCVINLLAPDERWTLFRVTSADRIRNVRPDFTVVARTVIEFGGANPAGRPSLGEGVICISTIWVGKTDALTKNIEKLPVPTLTKYESDAIRSLGHVKKAGKSRKPGER